MNLDDRWVRIYVREDRVGAVRLGQPATITADTYPGKRYAGEVSFIASEAEFTPEDRADRGGAGEARLRGEGADHRGSRPTISSPACPADVTHWRHEAR